MQLNQKESSLIKELKGQENLCIERYSKAAACAVDGQLKGLFTSLSDTERTHLDTLTQIENGTVPVMPAGPEPAPPAFTSVYGVSDTPDKRNDCYLCTDSLSGEKHVSALYDTCIFEFRDAGVRSALNHIQKEEQQHGKSIYDYMSANNMYG